MKNTSSPINAQNCPTWFKEFMLLFKSAWFVPQLVLAVWLWLGIWAPWKLIYDKGETLVNHYKHSVDETLDPSIRKRVESDSGIEELRHKCWDSTLWKYICHPEWFRLRQTTETHIERKEWETQVTDAIFWYSQNYTLTSENIPSSKELWGLIDMLIKFYEKYPDYWVLGLTGFTSPEWEEEKNRQLSIERAEYLRKIIERQAPQLKDFITKVSWMVWKLSYEDKEELLEIWKKKWINNIDELIKRYNKWPLTLDEKDRATMQRIYFRWVKIEYSWTRTVYTTNEIETWEIRIGDNSITWEDLFILLLPLLAGSLVIWAWYLIAVWNWKDNLERRFISSEIEWNNDNANIYREYLGWFPENYFNELVEIFSSRKDGFEVIIGGTKYKKENRKWKLISWISRYSQKNEYNNSVFTDRELVWEIEYIYLSWRISLSELYRSVYGCRERSTDSFEITLK